MKSKENIIECSECKYFDCCPCMWSLHNAACLTIQKPKKKSGLYFRNLIKQMNNKKIKGKERESNSRRS